MWDVSKGNKMSRKKNFWTLARVLCDIPNTSHQCQEGPGDDSKTPAVRVFLFDVMCYLSLSPFAHARCRWNILSRAQHHWIPAFAPHPFVISIPSGGNACLRHSDLNSHPTQPLPSSSFAIQLSTPSCLAIDSSQGVGSQGCNLGWSQAELSTWHLWLHDAHSGMSNAWLSRFHWPSLFSQCLFFIVLCLYVVSPTN